MDFMTNNKCSWDYKMTSKLTIIFTIILVSTTLIHGEEQYEDSTNICQRCDCITTDSKNSLNLNCAKDGIKNVLSDWPTHGDVLVAIFSYNNISTLKRMPPSNAKVELVFDHCGIRNMESNVFGDVKNVDLVDLSYNMLTSEALTADVFKGPYNHTTPEPISLRRLNLAYNQIHSLKKRLFKYVPNLKELNLEGNNMKIIDVPTQLALSTLNNLEVLNLASNMLTDLVDEAVIGMKKLRVINLSNNDIDLIPESLSRVGATLEMLIIDNNPIIDLDENSFISLHNIVELSLNNLTELRYVKPNTFSPMKHLKVLKMSDCELLTDIDKDAFSMNQTILELYLNDNSLGHVDKELLRWSTLRMLQMNGNPFECDCNLYNISFQLSYQITRHEEGATCVDPRNNNNVHILRLKQDICNVKIYSRATLRQIRQSFSLLRVTLVGLSITVITGAFVVIALSYAKWRKVKRNSSYPFASQVMYNPLSTERF